MLTNRNAIEANGQAKPPATVPSVAPAAPKPVEGFHGANGYAKPPAPAPSVAPAAPKPAVGFHGANGYAKPPAPGPSVTPAPPKPVVGFHGAVGDFKRRLIEATLAQAGGNRTRAAKALGLQRTYLLRLMREFQIRFPAALPPHRSDHSRPGPPQTG